MTLLSVFACLGAGLTGCRTVSWCTNLEHSTDEDAKTGRSFENEFGESNLIRPLWTSHFLLLDLPLPKSHFPLLVFGFLSYLSIIRPCCSAAVNMDCHHRHGGCRCTHLLFLRCPSLVPVASALTVANVHVCSPLALNDVCVCYWWWWMILIDIDVWVHFSCTLYILFFRCTYKEWLLMWRWMNTCSNLCVGDWLLNESASKGR